MPRLSHLWHLASFLSLTTAVSTSASSEDIVRDVAIIGGGSTGVYAAVQLQEKNTSFVVIERNDYLGGHAETLYLPDNEFLDYGVEGFFNNKISTDYLTQLGVDWKPLLPGSLITDNVNFKTGKKVSAPGGLLGTAAAAIKYRAAIEQFNFLSTGGYYLPNPVPEELLIPFGDFVEKYHLQGALNLIFTFACGTGNVLQRAVLDVVSNFGIPHINALLGGGYIRPTKGMGDMYKTAATKLGSDNILFNTKASKVTRSTSGVEITVTSADGTTNVIKAKKLLITIPPTTSNMAPFDLTPTESSLFNKWEWVSYYAGSVNNTGIPNGINVANLDPSHHPGYLPTTPFIWHFDSVGVNNYLTFKMIGESNFTASEARDLVISDIKRMGTAGTYDIQDPEIVTFVDHTPTTMTASVDDVRDGFYRDLYALQGQRNTFYTGLSFCSDYSTLLWNFTSSVVDQMVL